MKRTFFTTFWLCAAVALLTGCTWQHTRACPVDEAFTPPPLTGLGTPTAHP